MTYETVFVARQPIFDAGGRLWGYELMYREGPGDSEPGFSDELESTLSVMANICLCPDANFEHAKLLINLPRTKMLDSIPHALTPDRTVVVLPEQEGEDPEYVAKVEKLRQAGYTIALDDYMSRPGCGDLCSLADVLVIDVLDKSEGQLAVLAADAKECGAMTLARRVEDHDTLGVVQGLGFSLFQGFFFKEPNIISGRKLSSTMAARLQLFEIIEHDEPDFESLAKSIEVDVSICYRLLTFLNSPSFGFSKKITSIKQAVVLAGWEQIRSWLRLIVLTDMAPADKTMELAYLAAQRTKFLESCALESRHKDMADALSLLGLFSLLEPMFDLPMSTVLVHLAIDPEIKEALNREENAYTPWLALVESIDASAWTDADKIMHSLELAPERVAEAYQHAITWANTFFGSFR